MGGGGWEGGGGVDSVSGFLPFSRQIISISVESRCRPVGKFENSPFVSMKRGQGESFFGYPFVWALQAC